MTLLLYFMAFGWMLALFASVIGLTVWLLINLYLWLTEPADSKKQAASRQEGWNPNHLKRAGQG